MKTFQLNSLHIEQIGELFVTIAGFEFMSNQNLLEFDFILIDVEELIKETKDKWSGDVKARFTQINEFVKRKDVPIVFFCTQKSSKFILGISGIQTNLFESLGIEVDEIKMEGRKIEFNSNTQFSNFCQRYANEFEYLVGFASHPGTSIGSAKFKNTSVGFYTKDFVFFPALTEDSAINEEEFFTELYQVCKSIRKGDEVTIVPEWTNEYLLPGEKDEKDKLSRIEAEIEQLMQEKAVSEARLSSYLPMKQLWCTTGTTLENSAKMVFEELGFTLFPTVPGRDDIIMTIGDQTIIVEVKGVTKSAGEKNAAQLEKWLSTYLAEKEIKAKGILLVNAFREFPLVDRKQDAFPAQMIPYATQRNQCLLTTVQLSSILLYCRENADEKSKIIQELLTTVGIYDKFDKWNQYIQHAKIKDKKQSRSKSTTKTLKNKNASDS
jgi:hypothetical protein